MLVSIYHVVTRVPEEDSSKHQSQEQRHRAQDKSSPFFHKYCKKTEVSSLLSLKIAENEESKKNHLIEQCCRRFFNRPAIIQLCTHIRFQTFYPINRLLNKRKTLDYINVFITLKYYYLSTNQRLL